MKKITSIFIIASFLFTAGCGNTLKHDGKKYQPFGLVNEDDVKHKCVDYNANVGGIALGVIFLQSIIVPGYVVLYEIQEPYNIDKECMRKLDDKTDVQQKGKKSAR